MIAVKCHSLSFLPDLKASVAAMIWVCRGHLPCHYLHRSPTMYRLILYERPEKLCTPLRPSWITRLAATALPSGDCMQLLSITVVSIRVLLCYKRNRPVAHCLLSCMQFVYLIMLNACANMLIGKDLIDLFLENKKEMFRGRNVVSFYFICMHLFTTKWIGKLHCGMLLNPRPAGGGGGRLNAPPSGFSRIAKIRRRAAGFSPTLPPIFSATFVKISTQSHVRSGHQVRSSDPTTK